MGLDRPLRCNENYNEVGDKTSIDSQTTMGQLYASAQHDHINGMQMVDSKILRVSNEEDCSLVDVRHVLY